MGGIFGIFGLQLYYGLWLAANGHLFSLELKRDSSGCIQYDPFLFMDKIMVPIMAVFMVMMMASGMAMMATDARSAADAAKELSSASTTRPSATRSRRWVRSSAR